MDPILQGLIVAVVAFITSAGGLATAFKNRVKVDDRSRQEMIELLMGLAQSNIINHGMRFIDRGYVTTEEYEDLRRYLYDPYHKLGGNGTVERIMRAVERLPFRETIPMKEQIFREVPIRETDPTGLPTESQYKGEERRGRRREDD